MEIKDYVEKIVDNGKVEDMHKLSDVLSDVMEELCNYNEEMYEEYKMKLYKMANGPVLSKAMASEIVNNMRPYGERWTLDETKNIQNQFGLNDIRPADFYVVMNSAYNDYRDLFNDNIDMYAKFTDNFVHDEDAKEGKIFLYFTEIAE